MGSSTAKAAQGTSTTGASVRERRRTTRVKVRGLICDRGEVIDLSTKGMRLRVHRRWNEGHVRTITIVGGGSAVPVEARCVWCRQEGMFAHVVGLAFQHTPKTDLDRLAMIVSTTGTGEAD